MSKRLYFIALIFLCIRLFAEPVHGNVISEVVLDPQLPETLSIACNPEDFISVTLNDPYRLLTGFDVEIVIPPALQTYSNNFAYIVYSGVDPVPTAQRRNYTGNTLTENQFTADHRFYLQFPFSDRFNEPAGPATLVFDRNLMETDFPMILTIIPILKGIPFDSSTSFEVRIRPLIDDRGLLDLDIHCIEETTVLIDGENLADTPPHLLPEGIHHLEVSAPGYQSYTSTLTIRGGRMAEVSVWLEPELSSLTIDWPFTADFYLDGRRISVSRSTPIEVEPGAHELTVLWEDFQISESFSTESGKNYTISLFLDILTEED